MIHIKPFRGLRPVPEMASEIASPPYDVLDSKEAKIKTAGHPDSFLHVVKPEVDLPDNVDIYEEAVYKRGLKNLNRMIGQGLLIQDKSPCFYIYKMIMGDHVQTGLVAATSVEDYLRNRIKKHEHTKPEKEEDRTRHILTLNAHTGPVIMMYRDHEEILRLIESGMKNNLLYDIVADYNIRHIIYKIEEEDLIRQIQEAFSALAFLYIGDGHHRTAAAAHVQEYYRQRNPDHMGNESYNYFLSVLFPTSQMQILDYNRVVKNLNGFTSESFMKKVSEKFEVVNCDFDMACKVEAYRPVKPHEFGMYLDNRWYIIEAKPNTFDHDDPVESLDISILQQNLLSPILGIHEPRTDKRIDFIGGIRGLEELERLVNEKHYAVAFSMFPTHVDQILNVADADEVMPPKSTWFEPKLRSGLIIHLINHILCKIP